VSLDRAVEVLDRLRVATPLAQSFSAGVACWDGRETSDQLLGRADHALYQVKQAGRNQVLPAGSAASPGRRQPDPAATAAAPQGG
jgi:GGDEF domain-containing protein